VLPSPPLVEPPASSRSTASRTFAFSLQGVEGIRLAYQTARKHLIPGGINRVVLATDGDFNVGVTDEGSLVRLVQQEAKGGVFLSVLGFGCGNLKDGMMEKLADRGNGNYAYIDTQSEARKVLVQQASGTLVTIAKDVKVQVEFNPALVSAYRLVGYENRLLKSEDFNDDKKDAGEIGAGHTVTALYEVVPAGRDGNVPGVDPLKFQKPGEPSVAALNGEMMHLKLRYKDPESDSSKLLEFAVRDNASAGGPSPDFRFAAAVAEFGMLLRESPHCGKANFEEVLELATGSVGADAGGYRKEFLELVRKARSLHRGQHVKKE
jgi:Ca-activated chloride channel homolog